MALTRLFRSHDCKLRRINPEYAKTIPQERVDFCLKYDSNFGTVKIMQAEALIGKNTPATFQRVSISTQRAERIEEMTECFEDLAGVVNNQTILAEIRERQASEE